LDGRPNLRVRRSKSYREVGNRFFENRTELGKMTDPERQIDNVRNDIGIKSEVHSSRSEELISQAAVLLLVRTVEQNLGHLTFRCRPERREIGRCLFFGGGE